MKLKILALTSMILLLVLGCSQNDELTEEIFFDPSVSTNTTDMGQTVTFKDYSSGVKSRKWTFPGGTPATSTEKEVDVQFYEVGLIMCTIENTFIDGITETKNIFIQVGSGLINYQVSAVNVEAGQTVTFTDNSNSVASRVWTFPGGSPATSNAAQVNVTFAQEGPVFCNLQVTFLNGIVDNKDIRIQVGDELYPRSVFGFENTQAATNVWQSWISNGSNAMQFSIENSPAGGANQTNGYAKIQINAPNVESQLFTKGVQGFPNAILESFTSYEFSFWIKSNEFNTVTAAELTNQSQSQNWNNFAWYSPIIEVSNQWSFKTITFQTGNLTQIYSEGTANNVWTQFKFIQQGTGTIYIDEISLKKL